MRIINKGRAYKVYMLTFPNGKRYIGYTGEALIETRIAKGYNHNKRIIKAMQQYAGQLKIDILADNITKTEAEESEIYFIALYQTTNSRKGYNYSTGGAAGRKGCKLTAKQRAAISGDNNPNRIATARKKCNRMIAQMQRALNFNPVEQMRNAERAAKMSFTMPTIQIKPPQLMPKLPDFEAQQKKLDNLFNFDFDIAGKFERAIEQMKEGLQDRHTA